MSLNGFYVGGPFNCSLSPPHASLSDRQVKENTGIERNRETPREAENINYLHTAHLISGAFFADIFPPMKGSAFMLFGAFMLDVCVSLKDSPWRGWPVWFLAFTSKKIMIKKKAKKGYFQHFITFIEYSHRDRRPTLFILGGLS